MIVDGEKLREERGRGRQMIVDGEERRWRHLDVLLGGNTVIYLP